MDSATSDFLNLPMRSQADVLELREPSDLGIPSGSPYHHTDMGDVPEVPYELRAHPPVWPSSRYGQRTIYDVTAYQEMDPTHWQREQARRYRARAWLAIGVSLIAFWGFIVWRVW